MHFVQFQRNYRRANASNERLNEVANGSEDTPNTAVNPVHQDIKMSSFKMNKEYDVCVVGAGFSGSVIAERFANELGKTVLVIDKRNHIGGNCYDYIDEETNIRVNKYGAHLFHTNHER
eukprot:9719838-Ditylum_brightwellii.AAC.1